MMPEVMSYVSVAGGLAAAAGPPPGGGPPDHSCGAWGPPATAPTAAAAPPWAAGGTNALHQCFRASRARLAFAGGSEDARAGGQWRQWQRHCLSLWKSWACHAGTLFITPNSILLCSRCLQFAGCKFAYCLEYGVRCASRQPVWSGNLPSVIGRPSLKCVKRGQVRKWEQHCCRLILNIASNPKYLVSCRRM